MSRTNLIAQEHSCPQSLCIQHLLQAQAERNPDAIAIAAPGRRPLSYLRLTRHVREIVAKLNSMGVGRNDRVAMVLPNGAEMATGFLAVAAAATAAPLNPEYRASEYDFYLADLNAKALMVQAGTDSLAIEAAQRRRIPIIKMSPEAEQEAGIFTITGSKIARGGGVPTFAHPDDVALVLHTSGTTSRPKIVPLTQTNICTSARNVRVALELTAGDRSLNVMPLFHIHGLIGALLSSLSAGGSIVCTQGLHLASFFKWMDEFKPTWYTATPAMHQAIVACANVNQEIIASCSLRFIRSCSSPLPPQVMLELEKVFAVPVIESYGMTEASHQIASNPLPPSTRKASSVGLPAGPEVAIMDEAGNSLAPGEIGEIAIHGSNVTRGYEDNSKEDTNAFTCGWFRTGDQGYLDPDGYLFITGRLKEIINRGGEKISPREVDEVLLNHPAVAQAAAFAVPHKILGEDVAAAITLRANATATEMELREFAAIHLADFKVPRRVVIVDEIPKGPTGKVQRVALAEKLGFTATGQLSGPASADSAAPRSSLEYALASIWAQLLHLDQIGIRENFFELGGHSLLAAQLVVQVEAKLGKSLPLNALVRTPTIEGMAKMLNRADLKSTLSSLVPLQPKGSKPPFFFVHGEFSNIYLPQILGLDQPTYALEHQSEDGKPARYKTVEDIAGHYLEAVLGVQPEGPYFLGGYCFGAMIAFEMAQQLLRQGKAVALVVLLAPVSIIACESSRMGSPYSFYLTRDLIRRLRAEIDRHLRNLIPLRLEEKLTYVSVRANNKIHEGIFTLEQIRKPITCSFYLAMKQLLPISLRSFYILGVYRKALRAYEPKSYPGRITLLKAKEDTRDVSAWATVATGGIETYEVPGDHDTVLKESAVSVWAEMLRDCLVKAQKETSAEQTHDKQYAAPLTTEQKGCAMSPFHDAGPNITPN